MTEFERVIRKTADESWPLNSGWGSHRAVVRVDDPSDAAMAVIEWRRRDQEPEKIGVRVKHLSTGEEISNIYIEKAAREEGIIVFKAPYEGLYGIYYLPFAIEGEQWYFPDVEYLKTDEMHCEPAWRASLKQSKIQKAELVAIECRTDFDSFEPMEVPATNREVKKLLSEYPDEPFLIFPEDRIYPIRMQKEIPQRWANKGPADNFKGSAQPGEYYVFQIGVWAKKDIDDIKVSFKGSDIHGLNLTCFNQEGFDWNGRSFIKHISVKTGFIQPLWIGADIPENAEGIYAFDVLISSPDYNKKTSVNLDVKGSVLPDHGDRDLWRLSRLRWLNSRTGIDDEVLEGYLPVEVSGDRVTCVGRGVCFNKTGLPSSICSYFSPENNSIGMEINEILSASVELDVIADNSKLTWSPDFFTVEKTSSGRADIHSRMSSKGLIYDCSAVMEFDGHIDTMITITAAEDISIDDINLNIPYKKDIAIYMMGFGREGGIRPEKWLYKWDMDKANNAVWIGTYYAGVQIKLKHTEDVWESYGYRKQGLPASWNNNGLGGCHITEQKDNILCNAFTGPRILKTGDELTFHFSLLITPLKAVDTDAHWEQRYYHTDTWEFDIPSLDKAVEADATVVNLHQGGSLNQYINYPFLKSAELKEQTDRAHKMGLKYKIYYTVRELSNHATELWMIRSLGDEVLREGPGFKPANHFTSEKHGNSTGGPWLCEHLTEGFVPAWQAKLGDGDYDSAVAMTGLSRWHNHYLEGLGWLLKKEGVDGIYLDGIGYDRQIMKRVRKSIDRTKDGCLIDFHSGNNFESCYGSSSPMNQYLELMPCIDSLWMGEGYDYEKTSPEYWLIEVSGIPFGLMGDMLHGGGNPWRGMVFGMTCRLGWQQGGDPSPIWKAWKEFGLEGSRMRGWWNRGCPVKTGFDKIKATVYMKTESTMVSIASWEDKAVDISLDIDWQALGIARDDALMEAPFIENFQPALKLNTGESLRVEPGRGWIIVIRKRG